MDNEETPIIRSCTSDEGSCGPSGSMDKVLPGDALIEIMSRMPTAKDAVNCAAACRTFHAGLQSVRSVRFLCKLDEVRRGTLREPFKNSVKKTLNQLKCVEKLRLEVEDEMPGVKLKDEEIDKHILWLSQTSFVDEWLPLVSETLRNLTVIDYGQQAIYIASQLLHRLSLKCKQLHTLELRNMFLATSFKDKKIVVQPMSRITTLTLRCMKLTDNGLKDLNECMPNLETLTLVTVVGLKEAEFTSEKLKVCCLGLATRVKSVKLSAPNLVRLQLKMPSPDKLVVHAPDLECLAICMDKRDINLTVDFDKVRLLKELLMGASEFKTLKTLCTRNYRVEKMFLDVPCLAFEDSGKYRGLLDAELDVPDMCAIRASCVKLSTLSIGPGLWYALEKDSLENKMVSEWPKLKRLIVHMIVLQPKEPRAQVSSIHLLADLVQRIPSLESLEVYIHVDSKVDVKHFDDRLKSQFPNVNVNCGDWKKGLRFECFSF